MAVLSQATTHAGNWECETCCRQYDSAQIKPWQTEEKDSLICPDCIAGQFSQALENDYSWPARFGPGELFIKDFEAVLDGDLVKEVLAKEAEYAARVDAGIAPEAVEGQVRGKDYQLCPRCSKVIGLRDGCNHMTCLCLQNFCFICGKEATAKSGHWSRLTPGACPRYGMIDSENAMFDNEDPDDRQVWLEDSRGEWNDEDFNDLLDHWSEFDIGPYAWSSAMQASRNDPVLRETMQRVLQAERWAPSPEDRELIERAMRAPGANHLVNDTRWNEAVAVDEDRFLSFLTHGPHPAEESPNAMVRRGVLAQPVGQFYNMTVTSGRMAAFIWMYNAVRDWSEDWIGREQSQVVFEMGPSREENSIDRWENRVNVARLMFALIHEGARISQGRFTFTAMRDTSILVTINAPQDTGHDHWRLTAYWHGELLWNFWAQMIFLTDDGDEGDEANEPLTRVWVSRYEAASAAWREQTGLRVL